MKACKSQQHDIINKELEKNIDLISEVKTKAKVQMNILHKEEVLEEKKRLEAKRLFSKRSQQNKIDVEGDQDLD